MKFNTYIAKILLPAVSVYIPLATYSTYQYIINLKNNDKSNIFQKEIIQKNIELKNSAIKEGYLPLYLPEKTKKYANNFGIYPIGSLPLSKTSFCSEGYGWITYKTDRFGLRNSDYKWNNIMNERNIFFIGDSFIHGACVPDDATIPEKVQKGTNSNVINLATGSNDPYEYLAIINSVVKPIIEFSEKSNIVILAFYANDNIPKSRKNDSLLKHAQPIISLSKTPEVVPTKFYIDNISSLIEDNYPTSTKEILKKTQQKKDKDKWQQGIFYQISTLYPFRAKLRSLLKNKSFKGSPSERSISLLSKVCKNLCKPIVVYIPNSSYWESIHNSVSYKIKLKEISTKKGIEFIDGEEVIDKNNKEDYAPEGSHLSIEGYTKLAELIKNSIKN